MREPLGHREHHEGTVRDGYRNVKYEFGMVRALLVHP